MNRASSWILLGRLLTGATFLLAGPAGAKDRLSGIITFNNGLGNVQYLCSGADPGYLASPINDIGISGLAGFNAAYPNHDFQPDPGTLAAGNTLPNHVSTIAYPDADGCSLCPYPRMFDANACFRGAIDPNGVDWTAGWTVHGDLPEVKPAGWETRNIVDLAGPQPTSTWTAANIYVLHGKVSFPAGTSLTIQPNALVVGENATTGYLVIERDADIHAMGTAAQPIVMTTDLDPPIIGGWGGLVIHGKAVANCADCLGGASCISEGGAGEHCGTDDCDSSGELHYVRVAFAGHELSPNNELNSFTFNSVGANTMVDHLQAHQGSDDEFEWFGGTVNAKYLIGTGGGDDGIDWQMGFRGTIQYAISQAYPNQGDKGIEADNNEFNFDAPCRSNPLLANLTLVGNRAGGSTDVTGIHMRRGTDAQIFNSIICDWNQYALRVEHDATCSGLNPVPPVNVTCNAVDAPLVPAGEARTDVRAFPNPVVNATTFSFSLPEQRVARLDVYDVSGRRVANVIDAELAAGFHAVAWTPAVALAAGTYFYRLETGSRPSQGRLVLMR